MTSGLVHKHKNLGVAALAAPLLLATPAWADVSEAQGAQVVFLGEQHDNPGHHAVQAEWVAALTPTALVFEMLTPENAAQISGDIRDDPAAIAAATKWEERGWPDFAMYYPIFAAAPEAAIYGAGVPRSQVRGLMEADLTEVAGADVAARFALDAPLEADQQAQREAMQKVAHCDALPDTMLPMMVAVQRLRDAVLADAALTALSETGGPVVVITGNGHAREDWGAPHAMSLAAPEVTYFSLGQGEAGDMPQGGFDAVLDGPAVDRGDPCDAFR